MAMHQASAAAMNTQASMACLAPSCAALKAHAAMAACMTTPRPRITIQPSKRWPFDFFASPAQDFIMPTVTILISDLPEGRLQIVSDYTPAIGSPCSPAQQAALEIVSRTKKQWGICSAPKPQPKPLPVAGLDIDAIHRRRDNVVAASA
jgi:hypothetical protein